jgi:hypothetical protein
MGIRPTMIRPKQVTNSMGTKKRREVVMGKRLWKTGLSVGLVLVLLSVAVPGVVRAEDECPCDEKTTRSRGCGEGDKGMVALEQNVRLLRKEINAWNLLNGLNLNEAQIRTIAKAAKRAQALKKPGRSGPLPSSAEEAKRALKIMEKIRDRLEEGKEIPEALIRELRGAGKRRGFKGRGGAPGRGGRGRRGIGFEIRALEEEVRAVLLPGQIEVLETYKACLLPPKNLKNPVRVGQANDSSRFVKILERFRRMPEHVFQDRKHEIVEKIMARAEKHVGRLPEEERQAEMQKIVALLDKARAMNEADFEINKEELAGKMRPKSRKDEIKKELEKRGRKAGKPGKIARFLLLDPAMVVVMEKRLQQIEKAQAKQKQEEKKAREKKPAAVTRAP